MARSCVSVVHNNSSNAQRWQYDVLPPFLFPSLLPGVAPGKPFPGAILLYICHLGTTIYSIPENSMSIRFLRTIASVLLLSFVMISCSSTTMITSEPPGAKLYINGMSVGNTPYTHSDTRIVGSMLMIKLEKEGYEPLNTFITRDERVDVGAVIGGLFLLVPFLWTMQYNPQHNYELAPLKK